MNVAAGLSKIAGKQNENRKPHNDYGRKGRSWAADTPWTPMPGGQVALSPLTRKKDHRHLRYPRDAF